MYPFVACISVGLVVLFSPPLANAQDGKGQPVTDIKAKPAGAGKAQSKGMVLSDFDQDGRQRPS